jgi:hypothetical protein
MCRIRQFLAILRSFFYSSLLYTPFLPHMSTNQSSILPPFILPSISWSTSQPCCFQICIEYFFGILNWFTFNFLKTNVGVRLYTIIHNLPLKENLWIIITEFTNTAKFCRWTYHRSKNMVQPYWGYQWKTWEYICRYCDKTCSHTLLFSYHNMRHKQIIQYTFIMFLCNSLTINTITILLTSAYNSEHEQCSIANKRHKSN